MDFNFYPTIITETIVKAASPLVQSCVLPVSNLDLLAGRAPVTYLYVYCKLTVDCSSSFIEILKSSLATALNHYHPFAGQIVLNSETGEPEIVCNNHGAKVVEASIDITLASLDFHDLNSSLGRLVSANHDFPFTLQITKCSCGGVAVSFTFDHLLGDGSSFGKFLKSWCEIARKKSISFVPDHRRILPARSPPTYDNSLDDTFICYKMVDSFPMLTTDSHLRRLYHVDAMNIDKLQRLSGKRTKIEAFSAYVWKIMSKAIGESETHCKMGWLVDGRRRFNKEAGDMFDYYVGNVLSMAVGEASVEELKRGSLTDIARVVHEAIVKTTNATHFQDLIDWVECHKPGLMLAKILLGHEGPCLVLSSGREFPVAELDFGYGSPVLGTLCPPISKIGAGYMDQRESAEGDGSWVVSAMIWPAFSEALESDPDHVFQPMTAAHLGL
ncbi:hypothetical protein Scep_009228 [Stephania cephalantha]|uniref:Uncharacterized protein n=1 Tax=Stephania cephalantha TaxID=152367 RepID=A0AAP0JV63_9MAGN